MRRSHPHSTTIRCHRVALLAVLIVVVMLTMSASAFAQSVTIKRTFFSGWKYSTDGKTFHEVGAGASDLMLVMEDHRVCIAALRSYREHSTAAKMTGLTSLALITFPLVSNAISGDWSDGSTPMILVGLGFGALSLALGESGSSNLKQAVRIYNRYQGRYQASHNTHLELPRHSNLALSLKLPI